MQQQILMTFRKRREKSELKGSSTSRFS